MKRILLMTLALGMIAAGCHTDMWVQPKSKPQHDSVVFEDGMSSRPRVAGTVARGKNMDDIRYFSGRDENSKLVTEIPVQRVMKERRVANYQDLIMRGKDRFEVFCTPCHGQLGDGQGMIAQRGLALKRQPANYHTDRLRKMPVGHFFDVMTNGYGVMYSFASRVPVSDRWAIASYIRALQRSQNGGVMPTPGEVPLDDVRVKVHFAPGVDPKSAGAPKWDATKTIENMRGDSGVSKNPYVDPKAEAGGPTSHAKFVSPAGKSNYSIDDRIDFDTSKVPGKNIYPPPLLFNSMTPSEMRKLYPKMSTKKRGQNH